MLVRLKARLQRIVQLLAWYKKGVQLTIASAADLDIYGYVRAREHRWQ